MHLQGVVLPGGVARDVWIDGDRITFQPVEGARTVASGVFLVPGLVDAHCHPGVGVGGPVSLGEAAEQAEADRDAGTLLIRDCGAPIDTRPLQRRPDLPKIIRSGRHLALPKRYLPGLAIELEDPEQLPAAVTEQAADGDGWVKLVGDWIDRSVGDLAPLWPDDVLERAVRTAHEAGARVTAHVFGEEALPGLVNAGIDCLEHGTGLSAGLVDEMVRRDIALVPTLINIENFPGIADKAGRYPTYAAHMRALHARVRQTVEAAVEAGVAVSRAATPEAWSPTGDWWTRSRLCTGRACRPSRHSARHRGTHATGWTSRGSPRERPRTCSCSTPIRGSTSACCATPGTSSCGGSSSVRDGPRMSVRHSRFTS